MFNLVLNFEIVCDDYHMTFLLLTKDGIMCSLECEIGQEYCIFYKYIKYMYCSVLLFNVNNVKRTMAPHLQCKHTDKIQNDETIPGTCIILRKKKLFQFP